MSIPFDEVIASRTFEFLLGTEKKSFTVHESLAACHSKPLKAMMTGRMAEAKEKRAVLSDVDPDTFVRFAQYIYTGDYSVPVPDLVVDSPKDETPRDFGWGVVKEPTSEWGVGKEPATDLEINTYNPPCLDVWLFRPQSVHSWGNSPNEEMPHYPVYFMNGLTDAPKPLQLKLGGHFVESCYESEEQVHQRPPIRPVCGNEGPQDQMADAFLAHARVYVFADTYGVQELARLAVHKLRQTLSALRLFPQRITDLVALIHYVYANTPDENVLRHLVVDYCACMLEYLMKDEDFTTLTEEDGSFSTELLKKIIPRLD